MTKPDTCVSCGQRASETLYACPDCSPPVPSQPEEAEAATLEHQLNAIPLRPDANATASSIPEPGEAVPGAVAHDSSCACFACHVEGRFEATCGEWCEHTPRNIDFAFHRYWQAVQAIEHVNPDDPNDDTPTDASMARVRIAQSFVIEAVLATEFPYLTPSLVKSSRS